jgi:hypothetical protein
VRLRFEGAYRGGIWLVGRQKGSAAFDGRKLFKEFHDLVPLRTQLCDQIADPRLCGLASDEQEKREEKEGDTWEKMYLQGKLPEKSTVFESIIPCPRGKCKTAEQVPRKSARAEAIIAALPLAFVPGNWYNGENGT